LSYNYDRVHLIGDIVDRLKNFKIGLTDTSPTEWASTADGNYTVCHSESGKFGGGTRTLSCVGTGRYLVVQLMGPSEELNLCEVEVYSGICMYSFISIQLRNVLWYCKFLNVLKLNPLLDIFFFIVIIVSLLHLIYS
jgi:hypothetical protein